MTIKNSLKTDMRYEAISGSHVAYASSLLSAHEFSGLTLGSDSVGLYPRTYNKFEVIKACEKLNSPWLLVSGSKTRLDHFITVAIKRTSKLSGSDEVTEVLNTLNTEFTDLTVQEFGFETTASNAPASGSYPVNISEAGKKIWDKVLESPRYATNVRGRSSDVRWAIAMKMYMDKALRLGAKPFAASVNSYSRKELTEAYQLTLANAGSLESQLRENLYERGFITNRTVKPWRFKEVSYNSKRFVCVLSRVWDIRTGVDHKNILKHLVRREQFEKNQDGAGWIIKASSNARIRVRIRGDHKFVEVDLFIMFSRDKLIHGLHIDSSNQRSMLDEFHKIMQQWFKTKRF